MRGVVSEALASGKACPDIPSGVVYREVRTDPERSGAHDRRE